MTRRLANWLTSYAEYTEVSEAPEMFHFWSGVSTIAGALRRRVWIDQDMWKWTPNFYIIFVAPPGIATKSTSISVGMNLLKQVDGIKMGAQSLTWQGLAVELQDSFEQVMPFKKDFLDDKNSSTLLSMSAITFEVSELGTMLDPRDKMLISVLTDLWDGKEGTWMRKLKSRENTSITNAWVNIIAATTPSWIRDNFTEAMIGGGLASRIVFVYADKKKYLIPYVSELVRPPERRKLEEDLVHDLTEISSMLGQFVITPEALEFGSAWYKQHTHFPEEHLKPERMQGYAARKQTHIHKLAMIFSASESNDLVITKRHLELALAIAAGIERDMHIVFENIGMRQSAQDMELLMSYIRHNKQIPHQDLWRECMHFMSRKEFQEAIDSLVHAGYIRIVNESGSVSIHTTGQQESRTLQ